MRFEFKIIVKQYQQLKKSGYSLFDCSKFKLSKSIDYITLN